MRAILTATAAAAMLAATPVRAAEICAWMTETLGEENYREVELWLQADADVDFFYSMKGQGMKEAGEDGSRAHSPGSGTFVLHKGEAKKPWGFGMTLYPPAEIDIIAEVRAWPKDIFAYEEPPLLTAFTFRRAIPEGEENPPATLAAKQCRKVDFPPAR